MTYWNKNVILSLLIIVGCSRGTNKKLQEDFVSKYEQRTKNNSGLNCHSYFLKTIKLRPEDTYFEYFIFVQDGTLFFNYGDSISYIKESTMFSIDSIERKKNKVGHWGYYAIKQDTVNIHLLHNERIGYFSKDTLFLSSFNFYSYPVELNDNLKDNLKYPDTLIRKSNPLAVDSTNVLMRK
jgi:hypothetical protein